MVRCKALATLVAAVALLGGCHARVHSGPTITHAWVRLAAVPGRPAAAYFTLRGGEAPARLVAIASTKATSIELHESMKAGGGAMGPMGGGAMMTMRKLDGVDLPAGSKVKFAPGGYHAMVFGLDPAIAPGGKVPLSFRFAKGDMIQVDAAAVAAGDPAPR